MSWTSVSAAAAVTLTMLGVVAVLLLYVIGRAVASVAADELKGWLALIAGGLVSLAVARVPEGERDRYREEWLAELLAYQPRPLSALAFAIRVRLGVRELVKELPSAIEPSTSAIVEGQSSAIVPNGPRPADREFGSLLGHARRQAGLTGSELSEQLYFSERT